MEYTHLKSYTIDRGYGRTMPVIFYKKFRRFECTDDGLFYEQEYENVFVAKYGEILHVDEVNRNQFKVY